jgi:hypothetical protein
MKLLGFDENRNMALSQITVIIKSGSTFIVENYFAIVKNPYQQWIYL